MSNNPPRKSTPRSFRRSIVVAKNTNKNTRSELDVASEILQHNFHIYWLRLLKELVKSGKYEDLGAYLHTAEDNMTGLPKKFGFDARQWNDDVYKVVDNMRHRKFMWHMERDENKVDIYSRKSRKEDADFMLGMLNRYEKANKKILNKGVIIGPSVKALTKLFKLNNTQQYILQFLVDSELALSSRIYRSEYASMLSSYEIKSLYKQNMFEVFRILVGNVSKPDMDDMAEKGIIFQADSNSKDLLAHHLGIEMTMSPYWPLVEKIYIRLILENKDLSFNSIVGYFQNKFKKKLSYNDFKDLDHVKISEKLVNQSLDKKSEGVNILFYGLPGTGKTETIHALAEKNKWKLIVIGENEDQEPFDRLQDLIFAQMFFKNFKNQRIVFLFDEMEDLLNIKREHMSKNKINRLLENTPFPIFWTTNNVDWFEQSLIRRMTYAHMFEIPDKSKRKDIWDKFVELNEVDIDTESVKEFSEHYHTAPSVISNVSEVAGKAKLKKEDTTKVIEGLMTAYNQGMKPKIVKDSYAGEFIPYDFALGNSDTNLETAIERLRAAKSMNWSMCLYGAPGTGKSAYARHIAKSLGIKVIYKRASDLISMWVGETEKNIAAAFKEAEHDGALLIFDEADSFLQSRAAARQSWEITAVNEMLTQMENSKVPFVCTTNLMSNLDEASLRRFIFKIKFDWLTHDQVNLAFKRFFNVEVDAPAHWKLSPGDFVAVAKRIKIMGELPKEEILNLMKAEFELKKIDSTRPIGFGR